MQWPDQDRFRNSERQPLGVNSLLQGYFKGTMRLHFYWVNVAGQSVPTIYLYIKTASNKNPKRKSVYTTQVSQIGMHRLLCMPLTINLRVTYACFLMY